MASLTQPNHHVAATLRKYAEKKAAEKRAGTGNPDRMTVADGQGGITASKGAVPHDPGEDALKSLQPDDGKGRDAAAVPGGGPDRLTVADGQGGITVSKGTVPVDPGEAEVKRDQPPNGISKRAANIRAALCQASPAMAAKLQKQADDTQASTPHDGVAQIDKRAGDGKPNIDLSTEVLAKIASAIMSTDDGVRFVHDTLEKQAGEQAARVQIQEAIEASQAYDYTEQVKSAAFDDLGHKVADIHDALAHSGVTEEDADAIIKQAAFHQERLTALEQYHPLLKQAYAQGMDDAALLAAADEAGGMDGAPPIEEAMPMGGEELAEEEILALLEEMLASGQITEEDILEAVAATQGAGGELGLEGLEGEEGLPAEELIPA